MATRVALEAKLNKTFADGDYELFAQLQEQLKNLPDDLLSSSSAPEDNHPLTIDAKLRTIANMLKKSYDVGRETMRVSVTHGHAIPRATLERMAQLKAWQQKIDGALATRAGPVFDSLADTARQVSTCELMQTRT